VDAYAAVEDHGLIGDLQTAALVTKDGTIDWLCLPRFDSPSVFGALLDRRKGGHFRIAPHGVAYTTKQLYLPGTPILMTRFLSADGVGEVVDFMPVAGEVATDRHRLVRLIRVVRGEMSFEVDLQPRFDYGRAAHDTEVTPDGAVFRGGGLALTVHVSRRAERLVPPDAVRRVDGGLAALVPLEAGGFGGVVL
jgi:GH15 family glucan-1,4-alpha-glucosidase